MEGADLAALIAGQPAGHSLAQPFYRDPRIFERDIERIFMRHWLCAGHAGALPRRGDYFLVEYGAESVIVARGEDGELRALVNVCRHRGSRVCSAPGNARSFSCPYHGWTYGLDGKLLAARHMPADFDLGSHGLRRIELRVVAGLILISFAEHPLGLAHAEETIASSFEPYGWSEARVAQRKTYAIDANWKLAVENYLECYHCSPAHPEYSRLHALEQPLVRIEALDARMRERSAALGLDIPTREHWDPSSRGEEAVFGFRYPLYDEVLTGSRDGKPVAPLMGGLRDYDGGVTSVHFGPASFFIAYGDHGVIYRFVPKTVDRSELEVIWLVRGDAREGVDYDLEAL
ncbi:MAG TPA: aromatic ring-hydroxylating dioxygenase subunit alpha, partial [Stellaceae bacterium]|nr:aromatic ring-hydroxylating dioxygenase subunit alpha [Stellaceae bacterium]